MTEQAFHIRAVAEMLGHSRRPSDLVARYGGEEFTVILPDTPLVAAEMLAEKFCAEIEGLGIAHALASGGSHVTLNAGAACTEDAGIAALTDLIEAADKRLYRAKETGRNRVCISPD